MSESCNGVQTNVNWSQLPVELWLKIFQYLPQPVIIFVIRRVCRLFKDITFDSLLWKILNLSTWRDCSTLSYLKLDEDDYVPVDKMVKHDDIDELTACLHQNGQLTSFFIFSPVVNRVCKSIQSLTFSRYTEDFVLSDDEQKALYSCCNLTFLDVGFCDQVDSDILKNICASCPKLKTLVLEGCKQVCDKSLNEINSLRSLEKLDISHCTCVTDKGITNLNLCSNLKQFLSNGVLHLTDIAVMHLVSNQTKLEVLVLDGENLSDHSVFIAARMLPYLHTLQIFFCSNLTDVSFHSLAEKPNFRQLQLKKLSNDITRRAVSRLFSQNSMIKLTHLTLTDCDAVADETLAAISNTCLMLEHARFDWCCEITDVGIESLIKSCSKLKSLYLVGLVRLKGAWLSEIDKLLPALTLLDMSVCNMIPDQELFRLVERKQDLVAYTYYHDKADFDSVESLSEDLRLAQEPQKIKSCPDPPVCPGSRGARVDF